MQPWYRPTFAPEHGALLVLFGSLLSGAALAQSWTSNTTWACVCAGCALQAEHPLVVQLKQRRSWKPRYLVWAGIYGSLSLSMALYLALKTPELLGLYFLGLISLLIDGIAVLKHQQKSIANELVMFAAICLSTLLAYGATTGALTVQAWGLWILNTLFYASAIFTIKLRKTKTNHLKPGAIFLGIAVLVTLGLFYYQWLLPLTALTLALAVLKFGVVVWQRDWYTQCQFEHVARFETYFTVAYVCLVALTVLPPTLPRA
ncbi:YwiC-like family protein [Acaryochloris sp. IP29b_bin.137]|uniref:YwiC-like family protein n=1 Tax=Acaryochloris sp. IP29b_bin.137 TaxID=2969217 RepID=UPI002603FF13|nr:YwiC-like family protein [Acaryochloris sp. IP29b_bin.137]